MSGSEYLCPFEDIRWTDRFAEFSKDNLERLKVVPHFVDEAIKLAHEKESSFVTWLYIDRKNEQLARRLAQKGYYAKVKPLIEKELQALDTFAQAKNDEEIDNVYDMLKQERKQLVVPIRISVNEKLRTWQNESYEPYQKYKENLKYETDNGESVRSKSEVIIANILAKNNEHLLYDVEVKRYFDLNDIELLRTACSHNSQKHS